MDETKLNIRLIGTIIGVIVIVILLLAAFPFAFVGAGERGVVFNNVNGVENRILGEGVHFRIPFVESVTKMSVKVQKNDIKADAASRDLQIVNTDIVVNWHLDAGKVNKVYQNVGDMNAVVDRILAPAVSEVVKASAAKYNAEEIIAQRPLLKKDIDDALMIRVAPYHVVLDDISIINVDFSKEFNDAIEQKQIQEQNAKRAVFIAQQAEQEAQAEVNRAKGAAEAQRLQQTTLTDLLLQKMYLEKWDGHLPTYVAGNSGAMLFNLPTR
jgi:regulator of protease activity HflC (stomatin/prohibitin superfamily)